MSTSASSPPRDWNGNMAARLLYRPIVSVPLLATTVGVFLL